MTDTAAESPSRPSRPSFLWFALSFATLLASGVLNLFAGSARERHFSALRESCPSTVVPAEFSMSIAFDDAHLRSANLFLIALAGAFALFATRLELKRRRAGSDWITVCAWTRRVLWNGRWVSFEEFLALRYDVRCTHGICDEEADKLRSS